jgi:cell division protein FtsN
VPSAALPIPPAAPPVLNASPSSAAEPASERAAERASSYLLQVAAYRSQEDAESTKGRLALVGLEAAIVRAEVSGTAFWRVRVGPFKDLDEANRARARLSENGFDSSIVRLR